MNLGFNLVIFFITNSIRLLYPLPITFSGSDTGRRVPAPYKTIRRRRPRREEPSASRVEGGDGVCGAEGLRRLAGASSP